MKNPRNVWSNSTMFDPNEPLWLGTSLDLHRGCLLKCSLPDEDEPAVFTVGHPQNNFEICLHDDALREFVRQADLALSKMSSGPVQNGPLADESQDGHTHTLKHLGWVCIDDGCPMDFVIESPERMLFRMGRSTTLELGFDIEPLQRFAQLATQAVAVLDSMTAKEEGEAA